MSHVIHQALLGAVTLALIAVQAPATAHSVAGTFTSDDEVRLVPFRTAGSGLVTIETFGYAGGVDANGAAVPAGGFDPVFALFSSDGTLLGYGDDGATRADPLTGGAFDAVLALLLPAGDYVVALSQFDNFAVGPTFAAGFLEAGSGNFTAAYGCAAGRFCDVNGAGRSGSFDISISGATVPEPTTLALVALLLPTLWMARRRPSLASSRL